MLVFKAFGSALFLSIYTTAFIAAPISNIFPSLVGKVNGAEGGQADSSGPLTEYVTLAPRQAGDNGNNKGDTCECLTKCPNKHLHIDPKNCSRCIRCPANKVADPKSNYEKCVPDHGQTGDDAKKRREHKEEKWPKKKKRMAQKFKDKAPDRKKTIDKRKARRMSLCVPVAIMGLEPWVASTYMDGFFSEDYLESDDVLEYWPEGLVIEEWELETWNDADEETFYTGGYLDVWVDYALEKWGVGEFDTDLDKRGVDSDAVPTVGRHRRGLQKRRVVVLIRGVIHSIQSIANKRYAESVSRKFDNFFGNRGPTLGKGRSRERQGTAVKGMRDSGPLQWCLRRETPLNHT